MNTRASIENADLLMSQGDDRAAKKVLEQLIATNPTQKSVYSDAVNIYMAGNMYEEAKTLFTKYEHATGKKLEGLTGPDFTLASIEKEEHKKDGPGTKDTTVFNAGIFYALSNGISKITMNAESLQIVKRGQLYTMPWAAITDARLTSEIIRGGKYINNYTYNTINLSTAKQSFTFHSSPYLPNHFKNNMEGRLIPELKKYVSVSTTKNSKPHLRMNAQSWVVLVVIVVVLLALTFVLPSGN